MMVKVLFSLDGWEVVKDDHELTYARHVTCAETPQSDNLGWVESDPLDADGCDPSFSCFYCEVPVPEEIQGMMVMLIAGV